MKAKTSAKPKKKSKLRAARSASLTTEQRRRLLRPRPGYEDTVVALLEAWKQTRREVFVPSISMVQLRRLLASARSAWAREEKARERAEAMVRKASDRRLLAEHAVWKAVLDVYRLSKAYARRSKSVAEAFAAVKALMSDNPKAKSREPLSR